MAALDVPAVHAALAPASGLLAERRALYSLAIELVCPDVMGTTLPERSLDHPLVRFQLGEALGGRRCVSVDELAHAEDSLGATLSVAWGTERLAVVADEPAREALAELLRVVQPEPGLALLTRADGRRFDDAFALVEQGVALARAVNRGLADDLLAHTELLVVLKSDTSHGLVSASSRYFPGIVLIGEPATAIEVAEALVHEGAHQKLFDLAITRSFLVEESDGLERFEPSWSGARWAMEQVLAAWHAYSCLAQFNDFLRDQPVGASSLLSKARQRASEIATWLQDRRSYLGRDAQWMIDVLTGCPSAPKSEIVASVPVTSGTFRTDPAVRLGHREDSGRLIVGRNAEMPELYWLEKDPADVLQLVSSKEDVGFEQLAEQLCIIWRVGPSVSRHRLASALGYLTPFLSSKDTTTR